MKKLSLEQKIYWLQRRDKRERKRCKKHRKTSQRQHPSIIMIDAPRCIQLAPKKERKQTLSFLHNVRDATKSSRHIRINFKNTNQIYADAAILLRAELERMQKYFPQVYFSCLLPESKRIKQVLYQINVLNILNYKKKIEVHLDDVVHWKHAHGNKVEGDKFDTILGKYSGTLSEYITSGLYPSITEAMANSCEHAYILNREDALNINDRTNDWWMFSQETNHKLNVVFCDLGAGIPRTIDRKENKFWASIQEIWRKDKNDAKVIEFATKHGESRTDLGYRGKGLPQLVKNILNIKDGALRIFSNRGMITYHEHSDHAEKYLFTDSIYGTIILWEIPISQEQLP